MTGLFQTDDSPAKTLAAFKAHLRDFLVQMKEFEASDNAGLVRPALPSAFRGQWAWNRSRFGSD